MNSDQSTATLDEMVERVAKSDAAHLLIDGEQGPWPGTAQWEREVRENAREVLIAAGVASDEEHQR